MKQHLFNYTAGIIFLIVASLHLMRSITGWDLIIADIHIPRYMNFLAAVVIGSMAYWAFRLENKSFHKLKLANKQLKKEIKQKNDTAKAAKETSQDENTAEPGTETRQPHDPGSTLR